MVPTGLTFGLGPVEFCDVVFSTHNRFRCSPPISLYHFDRMPSPTRDIHELSPLRFQPSEHNGTKKERRKQNVNTSLFPIPFHIASANERPREARNTRESRERVAIIDKNENATRRDQLRSRYRLL